MNLIIPKTKPSWKMKWKIALVSLSGIILFVWFILISIAPLTKMREFKNLVSADSLFIERFDSIYYRPEMSILLIEKTYKEALLKLSESDSIQLVINFADSTVNLSIKGVMIHQTKVNYLDKGKLLTKIPLIQEIKIFSQPLRVKSQFATIVKEPVVVRHAPKDTIEAALNAWQPDSLIEKPAFVAFSVEHNIRVILEQDNNKRFRDKWQKFNFQSRLFCKKTITSFVHFIKFKKQDYQPTIIIKMPADDLRAIYRALPTNSLIVLKL